jgi:hopanoid biosynthesis associated RND transporter like protein HpnN
VYREEREIERRVPGELNRFVAAESTKTSESLAVRALQWLARMLYKRQRLFFYPQIFLFLLGVFYTVKNLEFHTDRSDLVGAEKKYHQNFLQFKKEFPTQDDLVVVVESEALEKNRQFVERLGARLEHETNLFADVFYKGDLRMLGHKALLFVPEPDLRDLQATLHDYRPFLQQFTRATNFVSLFSTINTQFRTARPEKSANTDSIVRAIPALERIITQGTEAMLRPGTPPAPGINALFGAGEEAEREMYITFAKGQIYLVTARAPVAELNYEAARRLRELVAETQEEVPGVNVGVTGEPILEVDEMEQSQHDSTIATIISLVVCALIFIYAYRQIGRPLKATFCLIIGLGYTMAFTTLAVGHLNILTITFVPILIGLAIDFGVHLTTRFEEELHNGRNLKDAMELAMVNTGLGIFTGAFTTAGAFFAMAATRFKGIQEMGIICGGGMLLCLVPMMTMLPVLLLRGKQNALDRSSSPKVNRRAQLENIWLRRPVLVAAIAGTLCILALSQARKVFFDYNLLNMQSEGLPAVEYEKKLINSAGQSVLFAAVVANSAEEASRLEQQITNLPTVAKVESMTRFLTASEGEKLDIVRQIKEEVSQIRFRELNFEPIDVPELSSTLWYLQGYTGLGREMAQKEEPAIARQLESLRNSIVEFRRVMLREDAMTIDRLTRFEHALFTDIHQTFQSLQTQDASSGITVADLPQPLRNRFIGVSGKHMLQVYPKADVWQREHQEKFVTELRQALDPEDTNHPVITGTPVQLFEYTTLLKQSYEEAAWYALAAIALLVFIHFRSIACVLLALLPVGIGMLWLLGLMAVSDVPFNPANIMTLPLVIGIGVTNGIHILNRFAEEQSPGILAKSTGKAVLVSGLTTIAGFGSLIFAKHQGIASLGFVMSLGVTLCMVAALTFLPSLLTLLMKAGWKTKKLKGVTPGE